MKSFCEKTTDRTVYIIGLYAAVPVLALFLLQHTGIVDPTQLFYPCLFHRISGLYCPGCGGTRAVKALLDGDLISCLCYHPFVFYCAVCYVIFMGSHTLELIFTAIRRKRDDTKSPHNTFPVKGLTFRISYVYIGVLVILLQWMIKNLLLLLIGSNC